MTTPAESGCRYNLADVLTSMHGGARAADMLREFAEDPLVKPTLTQEYYNALYNEAERVQSIVGGEIHIKPKSVHEVKLTYKENITWHPQRS